MIIIDYLQLMSGTGENRNANREQEISNISRNLKGLAKELNVPIIALVAVKPCGRTTWCKRRKPRFRN